MVNTRSSTKKHEEKQRELKAEGQQQQQEPKQEPSSLTLSNLEDLPTTATTSQDKTKKTFDKTIIIDVGSVKEKNSNSKKNSRELTHEPYQKDKSTSFKSTRKSNVSKSTSILARKKKLELEAAEAKARIQMELIDKKLAADLADLEEDKYSSQSDNTEIHTQNDVDQEIEKWIDRSQLELEQQPVPRTGTQTDRPHPPPPPPPPGAGTDDTVHLLATALKDLAAASTTEGPNSRMLSRLCTPRDLPNFSGDPMEWLTFKQAYDESTQVCNFNEKENLWRLRKCLHGPAKEAVTALLIGATSPGIVMSTLELQFGNPDIIISKIIQSVNKLQVLSQEYHKDIVPFSIKVKNYVAAVSAIGNKEYLQGMNVVTMILAKLPTVLISKWVDYSYPFINEGIKPRLVILSEFLENEAIKTSKTAISLCNAYSDNFARRKQSDFQYRSQTLLVQNEQNEEKCKFCRVSKHTLTDCKKFKKSLRKDRWQFVKRSGLCYKCLISRHNKETCPAPACDIDACGQSHHRLLHYNTNFNTNQLSSVNITEITDTEESEPRSEIVSHINSNSCKILLKTVPLYIHGPNGIISVYALLDDGSTVSLISGELAERAGLQGSKQTMRVSGAFNNTELLCESEVMNFNVSNKDGQMFTLRARSVAELNLPVQSSSTVTLTNYDLGDDIKTMLCDGKHKKPQLLIGQDHYHLMLPLKIIKGKPNEPYVTHTALGWSVHGSVSAPRDQHQQQHSTLLINEDLEVMKSENEAMLREIHEEVRRSFTIESLGITCHPRQNSEDLRAREHLEQTAQLIDGRWHVGLPWKDVNCNTTDSYNTAEMRLKGVLKKMKNDYAYSSRYSERIEHLLKNDYAEEIKNPVHSSLKTWYLSHFGVDNPNKKKLRLVFDAAAKSNGLCLNDYLYKGPDLLVSLYGIMLRFRENRIAVTGDIRDMFLRVKILPEDQDSLRFLWKSSPSISDAPVKIYKMTSLIFGANCSPFVAQFVKNKNAERFHSSMPTAVEAIWKQHYMDDYIDSFEDEETATKVVKQVIQIHKQGGFDICNWTSNSETIINSLPKETLGPTAIRFKMSEQDDGERTLGLVWFPKEDMLGFDVSFKRIPETILSGQKIPTKREMLRVVMSLFDVYGFLSPITIKGKIMLQETWRNGIEWDDTITDNTYKKWLDWLKLLRSVNEVRLPRYHQTAMGGSEMQNALNAPNSSRRTRGAGTGYTNLELHVMCDASSQAVAAVAYWRWVNNNNQWQLSFISSKCRVAPVKHISIPRLELQGALLAARLANTIKNEHKIITEKIFFWCDSTTVLHWIHNEARTYKAFVAHRLGEIDELTQINQWRYIPTKMNVADIATRDTCELSDLKNEWLRGPAFLYQDESTWPLNIKLPPPSGVDLEHVMTLCVAPEHLPAVPEPERFSSWKKLLRTTCTVLVFIDKCKKLTGEMDRDQIEKAEQLLIKYSQMQSFPEDLQNLKNMKNIDRKSKLLTLTPFLDEYGVVRLDGRINAVTGILPETKQPVILDGRNHVTRLIVKHYHVNAAHGNQEKVVNDLKQKYWIIRLRPTVKHVTSKCMFCRIKRARPQPPRMGDLPFARMAHHQRAFSFCGVDLFGPMEVTVLRRREKRYGVLFTCLTVRAVHIEIVTRLTTDALIMALRRMAARRGWPQQIFSDNGTNLKGAHNELRKSISELNEDILKSEAINYGTTWNFIPPATPHWAGAWERLIRSVKTSLKVILKEHSPRDEVLSTLMAEVEQIVNGRPLTHVTVEPNSDESLTPNHFLLGSSSNLPVLGAFDNSDMFLKKQWRTSQRLADLFWKRWIREVLPQMLPRQKWQQDPRPLQVGDLVLIVDPESPRNVWPRGLIQQAIQGNDGRVRVVYIKTKSGVLCRPAARVARIPTEE